MTQRTDPFEARARELCAATGVDPDSRIYNGTLDARGHPAWTDFRDQARTEQLARSVALQFNPPPQDPKYQSAPYTVIGEHDEQTVRQLDNCMKVGNVVGGALCADGHLGYAMPVGGVIAYEGQVSISGVGYDIACGNMAVKVDVPYGMIAARIKPIMDEIGATISFGVGRSNNERVEHKLFDDDFLWKAADREDFKQKAREQLGTVGSGNHYVDIFEDEIGMTWIGVHFGSRGLGHTSATKYLKLAGGKDGIHVAPTIVDAHSELGQRYLAAMDLSGQYAYAGREWVVERVRRILGEPSVLDTVHNHHNFAWYERYNGRSVWVVRKGATPAFAGQRGFVGGSMGDNAVILEGAYGAGDELLRSTVHGAGRICSRNEAKRRFTRMEMDAWLREKGVTLVGGDLDESPMAYRRLSDVLKAHAGTVNILHTLTPRGVAMAGNGTFDPYKD